MSRRRVERRLHSRVALSGVTARVAVNDGGRRRRVGLVDMSLDGFCWRDLEPVERGTPVSISFRTRPLLGRSIRLDGIVIRHDGGTTAAQFLAVQERSRLDRFLRTKAPRLDPAGTVSAGARQAFDAVAAFRLLGMGLDQLTTGASRVIVVASPRPSDGKSFVAAGLAASFAAMGRRVLVVDADLHAPTQHLQFVVKGSPGLAQFLTGPTLERARASIQMTESGVALLPSGAAGMAPAQLMSRETAAELSAVLRNLGYQIVVIDCPPILTSAETLLFSRLADDTVLTVRSGATRERDMKQALELLERNGTAAAGVILNDYREAVGTWRPVANASAAAVRMETPAGASTEAAAPTSAAPAALPTSRVPV